MDNDILKLFERNTNPDIFKKLLESNIEENDKLEIKEKWLDPDRIAKIILGFANTNGGNIILGIKERTDGKFDITGLDGFNDKANIKKRIKKYLPRVLEFEITNIEFEDKKFQIIIIPYNIEYLPYVSNNEGKNIEINTVYVRRDTSTLKAGFEDLQELLNTRIENAHSNRKELTLEAHLNELKLLYRTLNEFDTLLSYENSIGYDQDIATDLEIDGMGFIRDTIEIKKEVIQKFIKKNKI